MTSGQPPLEVGATRPQFVIGSDDRWQVTNAYDWPASAFGKLSQTCTTTMIGRSTALGAAHCFYQNGWIATNWIAFGANNWGSITTPFGTFVFDSITIPGQWSSNQWDWDFAVLEFSPTRTPGDQTGWMGVEWNMTGTQWLIGYPVDLNKPFASQWMSFGSYYNASGSRYAHSIDMHSGNSGGCAYNSSHRCTGIQSTHFNIGGVVWNEVRRWDSVTYNFFDAYGNWP